MEPNPIDITYGFLESSAENTSLFRFLLLVLTADEDMKNLHGHFDVL